MSEPVPAIDNEPEDEDGELWQECDVCRGDGVSGHECGDDTCGCLWPEENRPCPKCDGDGGWDDGLAQDVRLR